MLKVRSPILHFFLLVLRVSRNFAPSPLESPRCFRRKAFKSTQDEGRPGYVVCAGVTESYSYHNEKKRYHYREKPEVQTNAYLVALYRAQENQQTPVGECIREMKSWKTSPRPSLNGEEWRTTTSRMMFLGRALSNNKWACKD